MTFQSVLKEFGFKKHNVTHDDGHKSSYWYNDKKEWYADVNKHIHFEEVWMTGKGLKQNQGYPGGYFYSTPELLKEELILKTK